MSTTLLPSSNTFDAPDLAEETDAEPAPERTGASQASDVHRSKISPDDPRLRIDPRVGRTLRRGPVLVAFIALGLVVAGALVAALAGSAPERAAGKIASSAPPVGPPGPAALPDVIRDAPVAGGSPARGAAMARSAGSPVPDAGTPIGAAPSGPTAEEQARREALLRARTAGLFAAVDDNIPPPVASGAESNRHPEPGRDAGGPAAPDPNRPADPNLQERKNGFLAGAGASEAAYVEKAVTPPRSPYEVKAGTVIPTVLLGGINSDLPGKIVAQVRENVYDTVTGNHLLIPQGSRLLASYDSMVAWGQERVLVCWNRLIRPDGSSLTLECMPGVDLAGYAGFADEVDNHWWRILGGVVFSSVLAATAQRSQGDVTGYQPTYPQVWANNAAGQINQAGQQLTQRNVQIQPTLTVRPGFSVNVLVTKDIVIGPYEQGASP